MDLDMLKVSIAAKLPVIPICSAIVGCNDQISFSQVNDKIVFLQGFNRIRIIPMLQNNLIQFRKQLSKKEYLFAVQTMDTFQAVCKHNVIHSWCIPTGKRFDEVARPFVISEKCRGLGGGIDNSAFEVYRSR